MRKLHRLFARLFKRRLYSADIGSLREGFIYRFYAKNDEQAWKKAEAAISKFNWILLPRIENPQVVNLYEGE